MSTPTETAPELASEVVSRMWVLFPAGSYRRHDLTKLVKDIAAMEAALATLQAENAELRDARAEVQKWTDTATDLLGEVNPLRAEAATLRERLEAAERGRNEIDKESKEHFSAWRSAHSRAADAQARATAAEGERDRLREALGRWIKRAETVRDNPEATSDAQDAAIVTLTALKAIQEASLAAIPHTEGEASAPPKETTP